MKFVRGDRNQPLVIFIPYEARQEPFVNYGKFKHTETDYGTLQLLFMAQVARRESAKVLKKVGGDRLWLDSCGLYVEVVDDGWYYYLYENEEDEIVEVIDEEGEGDDGDEDGDEDGEGEEKKEKKKKKYKTKSVDPRVMLTRDWMRFCFWTMNYQPLVKIKKVDPHKSCWKELISTIETSSQMAGILRRYSCIRELRAAPDMDDLSTAFNIYTAVAARLMTKRKITAAEAYALVYDGRDGVDIDRDDLIRMSNSQWPSPVNANQTYRLDYNDCMPDRFNRNLPPTFRVPSHFLNTSGLLRMNWQAFFDQSQKYIRGDFVDDGPDTIDRKWQRRLDTLRLSGIYLNPSVYEGEVVSLCFTVKDDLGPNILHQRVRVKEALADVDPYFSMSQYLLDYFYQHDKLYGCLSEALFFHSLMSCNFMADNLQMAPAVVIDGPTGSAKSYLLGRVKALHPSPNVVTYKTAISQVTGSLNERGILSINDDTNPRDFGAAEVARSDAEDRFCYSTGRSVVETGDQCELIKKILTMNGKMRTERGFHDTETGQTRRVTTDTQYYGCFAWLTNLAFALIPTPIQSRCFNMPIYEQLISGGERKTDVIDSMTQVDTTLTVQATNITKTIQEFWFRVAVYRMYVCFSMGERGSGALPAVDLVVFDRLFNLLTYEIDKRLTSRPRDPRSFAISKKLAISDTLHRAYQILAMGIGAPPPTRSFTESDLICIVPFLHCTASVALFRIYHQQSLTGRLQRMVVRALVDMNSDVRYFVDHLMDAPTRSTGDNLTVVPPSSSDGQQQRLAPASSLAAFRRQHPGANRRCRYPTFTASYHVTGEIPPHDWVEAQFIRPDYVGPERLAMQVRLANGQMERGVLVDDRMDYELINDGGHSDLRPNGRPTRVVELTVEESSRRAEESQKPWNPLIDREAYVRIPDIFPLRSEGGDRGGGGRHGRISTLSNSNPPMAASSESFSILCKPKTQSEHIEDLTRLVEPVLKVKTLQDQLFCCLSAMTSRRRPGKKKKVKRQRMPNGMERNVVEHEPTTVPDLIIAYDNGRPTVYLNREAIRSSRSDVALDSIRLIQPPDLAPDTPLVYPDIERLPSLRVEKLQPTGNHRNYILNSNHNLHKNTEVMLGIFEEDRAEFERQTKRKQLRYSVSFCRRAHRQFIDRHIPPSSPLHCHYSDERVINLLTRRYHTVTSAIDKDLLSGGQSRPEGPSEEVWPLIRDWYQSLIDYGALHYCLTPNILVEWLWIQGYTGVKDKGGKMTANSTFRGQLMKYWRLLYPDIRLPERCKVIEVDRHCQEQWQFRPYYGQVADVWDPDEEVSAVVDDDVKMNGNHQEQPSQPQQQNQELDRAEIREKRQRHFMADFVPFQTPPSSSSLRSSSSLSSSSSSSSSSSFPSYRNMESPLSSENSLLLDEDDPFACDDLLTNKRQRVEQECTMTQFQ